MSRLPESSGDVRAATTDDKSLLSRIIDDSSQPIDFGARIHEAEAYGEKIGLSTIAVSNVEGDTKLYKSDKIEASITRRKLPEQGNISDVDLKVTKGPAVIGIELCDKKGKKNGSSLIFEFDTSGKIKKTVPDLDLVQIEKVDGRDIAYIEVGKKKSILPFSIDKIDTYKKEISQLSALRNPERVAKSFEEEPTQATSLSKEALADATKEDLKAYYVHNLKSKWDAESAGLDSTAHTEQLKMIESSFDPKDREKIIAESLKTAQVEYLDLLSLKLDNVIDEMVSCKVSRFETGATSADFQMKICERRLKMAGITDQQIKDVKKASLARAFEKSVESEIIDRVSGKDPVDSMRAQKFVKDMMGEAGVALSSIKSLEKDIVSKKVDEARHAAVDMPEAERGIISKVTEKMLSSPIHAKTQNIEEQHKTSYAKPKMKQKTASREM